MLFLPVIKIFISAILFPAHGYADLLVTLWNEDQQLSVLLTTNINAKISGDARTRAAYWMVYPLPGGPQWTMD